MLSIQDNLYKTIRLASTPLSSIIFIPSKNTQLITAYENGNVILIDTEFSDTIDLSLKYPDMCKSIIRVLRAHPTKPLVIMAFDDRSIALWDLRYNRKLRKQEIIAVICFMFSKKIVGCDFIFYKNL